MVLLLLLLLRVGAGLGIVPRTLESLDTVLIHGDKCIGCLHPEVGFCVFRLLCIRVYQEKTEILSAETMPARAPERSELESERRAGTDSLPALEVHLSIPWLASLECLLECLVGALGLPVDNDGGHDWCEHRTAAGAKTRRDDT